MNLQTEMSCAEVAQLLATANQSGKVFRNYSQAVRWILQDWLASRTNAAAPFEQQDAVEYLRNYGRFGLSVKQYGREDRKQERAEEIGAVAAPQSSMLEQMLRNRAFFDAEAEKILKKLPVPEAEEVDPELEQMRAEAAEEGGEE